MTSLQNVLSKSDLFSQSSPATIRTLAALCSTTNRQSGEVLFLEGTPGRVFFVCLEGQVRVFKTTEDGREITVRLAGPGDSFGEVILFEQDHYPVSAVCISPCTFAEVPRDRFLSALDNPELRNDFIASLMKKQRYLAGRILTLSLLEVEDRFFQFLFQHFGKKQNYKISMSKKEFAAAIGTVPETFSRLLSRLSKRGILEWKGRSLTLAADAWDSYEDA